MRRHLLLTSLCIFGLAGSASAQSDSAQATLDEMVKTPPSGWDQLLQSSQPPLDPKVLPEWAVKVSKMATDGKDSDAARYAEAVDYAASTCDPKKEYTGRTQITLLITDLATGKEALASELTHKLASEHRGVVPERLFIWGKLLEQNNPALSAAVFKQILDAAPQRAWAIRTHLELGVDYARLGKTEDCNNEYREVLKLDPNNAMAADMVSGFKGDKAPQTTGSAAEHFNRGEQLFGQNQYKEAMAEYDRAIAADPTLAKAWVYKGDCYSAMGQADEAIRCYRKAISIDPKDRQAHRFLGDMLEKKFDASGDRAALTEAIACYKRAVDLSPDYNLAREALQRATEKASH